MCSGFASMEETQPNTYDICNYLQSRNQKFPLTEAFPKINSNFKFFFDQDMKRDHSIIFIKSKYRDAGFIINSKQGDKKNRTTKHVLESIGFVCQWNRSLLKLKDPKDYMKRFQKLSRTVNHDSHYNFSFVLFGTSKDPQSWYLKVRDYAADLPPFTHQGHACMLPVTINLNLKELNTNYKKSARVCSVLSISDNIIL